MTSSRKRKATDSCVIVEAARETELEAQRLEDETRSELSITWKVECWLDGVTRNEVAVERLCLGRPMRSVVVDMCTMFTAILLKQHGARTVGAMLRRFRASLNSLCITCGSDPHTVECALSVLGACPWLRQLTLFILPLPTADNGVYEASSVRMALSRCESLESLSLSIRRGNLVAAASLLPVALHLSSLKIELNFSEAASVEDDTFASALTALQQSLCVLHLSFRDMDSQQAAAPLEKTLAALVACMHLEELDLRVPNLALRDGLTQVMTDDSCVLSRLTHFVCTGPLKRVSNAEESARFASRLASLTYVSLMYDLKGASLDDAQPFFEQGLSRVAGQVFLMLPNAGAWTSVLCPMLVAGADARIRALRVDARQVAEVDFIMDCASFCVNGLARNSALTTLDLLIGAKDSCTSLTRSHLSEALFFALKANRTLTTLIVNTCAFGLDWLNDIATLDGKTSALREVICIGDWSEGPHYFELRDECDRRKPILAVVLGTLPLTCLEVQCEGIAWAIDAELLSAISMSPSLVKFELTEEDTGVSLFDDHDLRISEACAILHNNRLLRTLRLAVMDWTMPESRALTTALAANRTLTELNGIVLRANLARDIR